MSATPIWPGCPLSFEDHFVTGVGECLLERSLILGYRHVRWVACSFPRHLSPRCCPTVPIRCLVDSEQALSQRLESDSNRRPFAHCNSTRTSGAQLGKGSWGSRPMPFSGKERKCPFCSALSIHKGHFTNMEKAWFYKFSGLLTPAPIFPYLSGY